MSLNVPNILSLFRIVAAPFLLLTGWFGLPAGFFTLFGLMLLSDAADGYVARKTGQTSEFGAKLDSYGDMTVYLTTPLAAWWLWPDIIKEELPYIITVVGVYLLPAFFSFAKFGRIASYHTWSAKISAVLISIGIVLLFGFHDNRLFHLSICFVILEAIENITITFLLPKPEINVHSVWHLLKERR
ncbi:phosphatidylglycerophosphate synthase [Sulfurovum lithotrophicum]|uniref:Phosphatidylglycerophosphate synthase n=1 Tax=Sulfurovum lithotrophicum TaxID=206403 RepID=A0A7U4M0U7_9BACT|nr:CDP-alcohol phosphatidyltransferase family protein [Sulfurovum lithotrophicum]AKF24803.1 phosphatidylglycerophosphate synthase [Sulfurovum lithotrophicum]